MARSRQPDPVLLQSGDILVANADGRGGWQMVPVGPDDPHYAGWLVRVQADQRAAAVSSVNHGLWRYTWQMLLVLLVLALIAALVLVAAFRSALNLG